MERTPANDPVIEFRDVAYALPNGQPLLQGLNLEVQRGETLILLGRSGSGKTTTLKLVNRLLTPSGGEVLVNGVRTAESDVIRLRRSIGYVIQDVGLFPHFTVERNIGIVPRIEGWPAERIDLRVEELLRMVGLEPQLFPRTDLVTAFAEGVPGVNAFPAPVTPFEALRLNTTATTIFTPRPAAMQSYLGAAGCFVKGVLTPTATGCDPTGFPNGRRPGDDVVDIALDVMEGYLIPATAPGGLAPAYAGATPTLFTDGVQQIATQFGSTFPYLNTPNAGANGDGT